MNADVSFTSRQLNILGSLLLSGYLVFCIFGCFVGIGIAPEHESVAEIPQTDTPTLTSTGTSTSIPTDTPAVPTATMTRVFPTTQQVDETSTPSLAVDIVDARMMCEEWIEDRSVTSKVKFLWLTMQDYDLGNYHYKITGECESQNRFGATIRYRYSCELHADLDRRVWVLDALFME